MFVTILVMFLDWQHHTVRMANAGHCYPMLRKADGTVQRLEGGNGYPIGITPDAEFPEATFSIGPGEIVCAFTDGIVESMNEQSKLFGYKELERSIADSAGSPADVVKSIQKAIREHAGAAAQSDDLTLVCFGRVGAGVPAPQVLVTSPPAA
jgi:sigma-B regulation protein RsbU (phosphoserine phosphatase)